MKKMTLEDTENNYNAELRDLESLLQKSLGAELRLLKFQAQNLLSQGENYASMVLKVSATIRRRKNAPEEDLELVAKMKLENEFQKKFVDITIAFKKEFFIFEQLIPTYRELQRKAGFKDSELLDILPKFYGGRLSLNSDSQKADEDVILLMENLNFSGFKTMDRFKGELGQ